MHDLIPLSCLSAGAVGIIGQVVGRCEQVQRLREMGLRDGTRLEVVHSGSPCIIKVNGQKLCFRDCETMGVLVYREAAAMACEVVAKEVVKTPTTAGGARASLAVGSMVVGGSNGR